LDLVNINKKQLAESGVQEGCISDPLLCTSCENALFFSYRREKLSCGRMMSVMMLR